MNNKLKRILVFPLLFSILLTMINITDYTKIVVHAADDYTVTLADFTNSGEYLLTNFNPVGEGFADAPQIIFPKDLDDNGTSVAVKYGTGVFSSSSLQDRTVKVSKGTVLKTKMKDCKARKVIFEDDDISLSGVDVSEFFEGNTNTKVVEGCGFLFTESTQSIGQFKNSVIEEVTLKLQNAGCSFAETFKGTEHLTSLSITSNGKAIKTITSAFEDATVPIDVVTSLTSNLTTSGAVFCDGLLYNATVTNVASYAGLLTSMTNSIPDKGNGVWYSIYETKSPVPDKSLDLSSYGSWYGTVYKIHSDTPYDYIRVPVYNNQYFNQNKVITNRPVYIINTENKHLDVYNENSVPNTTVELNAYLDVYINKATINIHTGSETETIYVGDSYPFSEVLEDKVYYSDEACTTTFDKTQTPALGQTYDVYAKSGSEVITPDDTTMDMGTNTSTTTVTLEDKTTRTIGSDDITLTVADASTPAGAKKYVDYKNAKSYDIGVKVGNDKVSEFPNDVTITRPLPDDYDKTVNSGIKVLDYHDGVNKDPIEITATVDTTNNTYTFKTKKFSTYVLLYNNSNGTTDNWICDVQFNDSSNVAGQRPTSLVFHIYVNDVAYTTKNVTIDGTTEDGKARVSVDLPTTVAGSAADVTWDLDGNGSTAIDKYTGPVETTVSGVPTYTYTYSSTTGVLPVRINFIGDTADTSTRPAAIDIATVATYKNLQTKNISTNIIIDKTTSYTDKNVTYDLKDGTGSDIAGLETTFPDIPNYTKEVVGSTGMTQHIVKYTYVGSDTTDYNIKVMFMGDTADTSSRPDTLTAQTIVTYADGDTDVFNTDIVVSKTSGTNKVTVIYDNKSDSGADMVSVETTFPAVTNYEKNNETSGDTFANITYNYNPEKTVKLTATFTGDTEYLMNRPESLTVPVNYAYQDGTTKTENVTLTLASGSATATLDVKYSSKNAAGSAIQNITCNWPQVTGYASSASSATLEAQAVSYAMQYGTSQFQVKFAGDSSDTSSRPTQVELPVVVTYVNGDTIEETFIIPITGTTSTATFSYPGVYNKSLFSSIGWDFPEVVGYKLTGSGHVGTYTYDSSSEARTLKYTVKFDDDNNSSGLRPGNLKITFTNTSDTTDTITSELTIKDPTTTTTNEFSGTVTKTKASYNYKATKVETTSSTGKLDSYKVDLDGTTIKLTYSPEKIEKTYKATFSEDGDNEDKTRPTSISVDVYNGDNKVASGTLNVDNNWSVTLKMNKYIKGVEASYNAKFPDISNYSKSINGETATYKFTGTLSKAAAAKQAEINGGTGTGTDAEDHTYDIEFFDWIDYANRYPDLKKAFGYNKEQLYAHYIHFGIGEHRIATWTGKYANVNEDILAAYFPDDYKYKTNVTSASDSKYSEITGETGSSTTSTSTSTGTSKAQTEKVTITQNDDGTTTVKQKNSNGTITETKYDKEGNPISSITYATGDNFGNMFDMTAWILMLMSMIAIGFVVVDTHIDNKKRKQLFARIDV